MPPPKSPMPPVRIGSAIPTIVSTSGIKQQPGLKVAFDRGNDQGKKHEDRPSDHPENGADQHYDQQHNADGLVVPDHQNRRRDQAPESATCSAGP